MSVFFDGEKLCVQLSRGKDYKRVLELAKEYESEYIPTVGIYVFPPVKKIARTLFDLGYRFDESAKIFLKDKKSTLKEISVNNGCMDFKSMDGKYELYPFQKEGVKYMLGSNRNILLGDEMGLGKTPQAATYLKYKENCLPALIVAPASLKENWRKEVKKWAGLDAYVIEGRKAEYLSEEFVEKYPILIINYDILGTDNPEQKKYFSDIKRKIKKLKEKVRLAEDNETKQKLNVKIYTYKSLIKDYVIKVDGWCDELIKLNFNTIIADEIQSICNLTTIRTRAMNQICFTLAGAKKIFCSGTPYETKTLQFYPCLHILAEKTFPNEWVYKMRYCNPVKTFFGWSFEGLSNAEELHDKISKFMIRRLKKDVLKDLPPKIRSVIPMKISPQDRKLYDDIDAELEFAIVNKEKNALSKLEALKQAAFNAKKNSMIQWVKDYLEFNDCLVAFIWHQEACDLLKKEFEKVSVSITGKTPSRQREEIKEEFQNNEKIKLFIGQIKSAGVGLTLTRSRAVVFLEFGNTAPGMEQAEDRVHRLTQKADSVLAYYLVMENSIDEQQMEVLNKRNKDLKKVLDDKDEDLFSTEKEEEFNKLVLEEYKKRKNIK